MVEVARRATFTRLPWEFILPLLAALTLGFWGLSTPGFWYDERVTSEVVQYGPFVYPWDAPLIPYYILIWLWSLGGLLDSDTWLRGFSLLATLVAVVAISWAGRILAERRVALAAGLILALAPSAARYSQEARLYALALAFACVAILGFVAATRSTERRWWALYALAVAGLSFVAPFALIVLPAFVVLVLTEARTRARWRPWFIASLAVAPGLALQGVAAFRFSGMHDWVLVPTFSQLWEGLVWPAVVSTQGDAYSAALGFGIVIVVLGLMTRRGLMWVAATAAGALALWIGSQGPSSFWLVRSTLPLLGFLAVAAALAFKGRPRWSLPLVILVLVAVAWPSWERSRVEGGRGEDVKSAVAIVDEFSALGDVINTKSRGWLEYGIKRYSEDPTRFSFAETAQDRAWVFRGDAHDPQCEEVQVWEIPGGGLLTLCASLPEGWQADFQ